jgi:hypothetical protein
VRPELISFQAGLIERHPEVCAGFWECGAADLGKRRIKAAFEAYLDRELPKLKEDVSGPGRRLR